MSAIERCPRCGCASPVVQDGVCGGCFIADCCAQGIEARQGQDAQRPGAEHESPVAESDAPKGGHGDR